jgi:hypothetical protein
LHTHVLVRPIGLLNLLATAALCGAFASTASAADPGLQRVVAQTKPADGKPAGEGTTAGTSLDAAATRVSQFADARNALGSYYDEATKQFVVVVSPGSTLRATQVFQAVGASSRVETRSISKATVSAVQDRIAQRAFHPSAQQYGYASYLDLRTGKVVLNTDAPAAVTAALSQEFPGVIDQRAETVRDDFSRKADTPPFWGGSSIKAVGKVCTSGFVVKKPTGTRYLTTAGHCFPVGANVLTTNGNLSVGTVVQRGPIPPWDMELIGGKSYGSSIFVGGVDSSSGKHVVAAADPVVGFANYCRSGQTTGEKCGQKVTSVNAQVCTETGCKSPVIAYTGPASAAGDSGAPFYVYSTDGASVHIRGMHIAASSTTSYAEKWSRISSHLGVSIVT